MWLSEKLLLLQHLDLYYLSSTQRNFSGVKWFSLSLIFTPYPKEVGVLPPNYRHRVYVDSAFLWEVTHLFEGRSHGQKTVLNKGLEKASFFLKKMVNGHFIQDPFCKQRLWFFSHVTPTNSDGAYCWAMSCFRSPAYASLPAISSLMLPMVIISFMDLVI